MFFTVATYAQKRQGTAMQWKIAAELPASGGQDHSLGLAGPVAGVYHDRLIIGGGANFPEGMPWLGGIKKYYEDVFVFKKTGSKLLLSAKAKLPFPLAYAASCSSEKGIVVAGGENATGFSDKVFLLKLSPGRSEMTINELPMLPGGVTNASAVTIDGKVFLAGGETVSGVSNQFLVLDLEHPSAGWKQLSPVPVALSHTVLLIQNGKNGKAIYAAGGRKKNAGGISDLYSTLFEFDLQKNKWRERRSLPYPLAAGTGFAIGDRELILTGGDKGDTFQKTEQLIAAIAKEKDEARKDSLYREKNILQSTHPGFSREILSYHVEEDEWKVIDHFPFDTPVTTTAVVWDGCVIIPSGEIMAGIRSPKILIATLHETKENSRPEN
jgi:cyclically-permuted mutarotase family protein